MGSTSEVPPTRVVPPGVIPRLEPPPSLPSRRRVGRPSKSDSFDPWVEELLARDPAVSTRDLLASARRSGYEGGKTAFYALVARARERRSSASTAVAPGEISHHDVGEADVTYATGDRRRVRFFVSRLVYSGWLVASLVDDHEIEPVARALVDHFAAMGGVPLLARFEHPRPVADASHPGGGVAAWNLTFAYLAAQLGIGIEVRRPRGLGRRVKESFFQGRVFRDRADAAEALAAWCREIDLHTPSDAQPGAGATPATLLALERRRLRPLGVTPEDLELREPVFVGAGGMVLHGTNVYSMPAAAAGRVGALLLGRQRVRVVAGPFEAVHPRLFEPGARSLLREHAAEPPPPPDR